MTKVKSTPDAKAEIPVDKPAVKGKLGVLIALLQRPEGATLQAMQDATGWQAHSVRGALAGSLKKGKGLNIVSDKTETGRAYRIDGADGQ